MTIETLEATSYPQRAYRLCREKVSEFVEVTGDDPARWRRAAPPGFAAALLFVVAPELLADPAVRGAVIHGDQSFTWHRPLLLETDVAVSGSVDRVRTRGEVSFVTFSLLAADSDGALVEGKSTFLIGATPDPGPALEPAGPADKAPSGGAGGGLPSPRSASREDLVRYAAATRDWNPIHWDHDTGVEAGLGGVVVHGLFQSAWLTHVAALIAPGDRPLASARFRYTAPLRPGQAAEVRGDLAGPRIELTLVADEIVTVSARFEMAT